MAKYMLRRGMTRLPIDGIREIQREDLPPLKQGETVIFEPGMVVETDLDFGPWVEDGTLECVRENGDPPRPTRPAPAVVVKQETVTPMPAFVQVEVVKEEAAGETSAEDSSSDSTNGETPRRRRRQ